jgi:hypothetical protein
MMLLLALSAQEYARHAASDILRDGVAWQSAALASGLFAAIEPRLLRAWGLGPEALAELVAGGEAQGAGRACAQGSGSAGCTGLDQEARPLLRMWARTAWVPAAAVAPCAL